MAVNQAIGRLTDRLRILLSAAQPIPQPQLLENYMVDVNKLYASPYLKAADLPQGRRATAEIVAGSTAWFDQRDGSQREKVVLTLRSPSGQEWPKQLW